MEDEVKLDNNIDLNKALQEFETESAQEQVQIPLHKSPGVEVPRMARWVMKLSGGAIKEQRQAEYVLLVISLIIFGVSIYLFYSVLFPSVPASSAIHGLPPGSLIKK